MKNSPSRRGFLTLTTTTAVATLAGCLSSADDQIEPETPSEDREGTPEEFHYFLEDNGVDVDELAREADELFLTYASEADDVEESDGEIMVIYEIYKQALIHRGSEIEYLYAEISNPFDGQALGWGIDSAWVHEFDSADDEDPDDETAANETPSEDANRTPDYESAGNATDGEGIDMEIVTLWSNIMNTKVYEDDVEAVGNESDGNETAPENEVDANATEGDD